MINYLSLLLVALMMHLATSTTYYVVSDYYSSQHYDNNNTFTLQHYLNNTSEYFASHNQLHFLPGQHYMNTDLVLELIYNFTLSGYGTSQSVIVCSSPVKIILQCIDNFTIQDITLINCSHFSTISLMYLYTFYIVVGFIFTIYMSMSLLILLQE